MFTLPVVRSEFLLRSYEEATAKEMISTMPYLEPQDIADALLFCLGTPETVQVSKSGNGNINNNIFLIPWLNYTGTRYAHSTNWNKNLISIIVFNKWPSGHH